MRDELALSEGEAQLDESLFGVSTMGQLYLQCGRDTYYQTLLTNMAVASIVVWLM